MSSEYRSIPKSLCGEDDCPTPYEFCAGCVRADERERLRKQVEALESPRKIEVSALGAVVAMPVANLVWRSDVLAQLGGEELP